MREFVNFYANMSLGLFMGRSTTMLQLYRSHITWNDMGRRSYVLSTEGFKKISDDLLFEACLTEFCQRD